MSTIIGTRKFPSRAPAGPSGFSDNMLRSVDTEHPKTTAVMFGLICLLTFLLGIAVTLLLVKSPPVAQTFGATQAPPAHRVDQLNQIVSASLEQGIAQDTVTRGDSIGLLSQPHPLADLLQGLQPVASPLSAAAAQPVQQAAAPAPTPAVTPQEEEAALQELKAQRALGLHMRMLREAALARVYKVEANSKNGSQQLIFRPVNVELSRRFMKTLLRAAEERGEIVFPKELSTESGEVDLDTMLFNLVQNSLANDGTLEGAAAAREMTMRAFKAADVKPVAPSATQTYKVEPGDSLAYISLKFYGRPSDYTRIFNANRDLLKTPDRIKVGQVLTIPS